MVLHQIRYVETKYGNRVELQLIVSDEEKNVMWLERHCCMADNACTQLNFCMTLHN